MATYNILSKLSQVKLPNGTQYALVDRGLRYMVANAWASGASYYVGDYVIYENPTDGKDYLYKCKAENSDDTFNAANWTTVQVVSELKNIYKTIGNGIHYRGHTTSALYDGATSTQFPTITIVGMPYTPVQGDLVIVDKANISTTYATATAYNAHTYLKVITQVPYFAYYITTADITAAQNTSFDAISDKLAQLNGNIEFLYDGTTWNQLGSISDGLGDLAYKDSATGTYTAPTGSGSVTVKEYSSTKKSLGTTTITGTNGTVIASKASAGTAVNVAKTGTAVVYGKANVGSAVTVGTALGGTTTFVTSAISGASLTGTTTFVTSAISAASLSGTTTFVTSAISGASLGGTKTFNTNAISGVTITGTKTFNTDGVKISTTVDNECLEFVAASTASFDVSTSAASTGTVTLSTNPAATATVSLTTAAAATASVGISTTTAATGTVSLTTASITPAVEAPSSQTIVPAVTNGTITTYTFSDVTAAKVAESATTVATGALVNGSDVVIGINASDTPKDVSVGINDHATIVVR